MRGKLPASSNTSFIIRIIPAHAGQTRYRVARRRVSTDHPRACGANGTACRLTAGKCGSSPRMRGKRIPRHPVCQTIRIIPAHAGQTPAMPHRAGPSPDHPRACGANFSNVGNASTRVGSSPRMRGKRALFQILQGQPRIIPAHAGQTAIPRRAWDSCSDHPRACGANVYVQVAPSGKDGSSPRMRGKQRLVDGDLVHLRIIPAHAGQTHGRWKAPSATTDHPRACGANPASDPWSSDPSGSSPRMRGKPAPDGSSHQHDRIIPAHAGQTRPPRPRRPLRPDHPRACGANVCKLNLVHAFSGSSPRMRGKLRVAEEIAATHRIIPAHAGQTQPNCELDCPAPDHPRACGANWSPPMTSASANGSSPRMRGKL